jgi:hypothetical protein
VDYLRCGEHGVVLVTLAVPLATATVFYVDKVSLRHANAHSIVNAAVRFELELTQPPPSPAAEVRPVQRPMPPAALPGLLPEPPVIRSYASQHSSSSRRPALVT